MWLWDLTKVINTGVLHEGAIPLCVYTVRHRAKINHCTGALVLSVSAGRHCRGWPGISHTHQHMHTDVNAKTLTSTSDNSQALGWLARRNTLMNGK